MRFKISLLLSPIIFTFTWGEGWDCSCHLVDFVNSLNLYDDNHSAYYSLVYSDSGLPIPVNDLIELDKVSLLMTD